MDQGEEEEHKKAQDLVARGKRPTIVTASVTRKAENLSCFRTLHFYDLFLFALGYAFLALSHFF